MYKKFCDRCTNQISGGDIRAGTKPAPNSDECLDLCGDCGVKFQEWMDSGRPTD